MSQSVPAYHSISTIPNRCDTCRSLDLWRATERLPGYTLSALVDGVVLARLRTFEDPKDCDMCQLLSRLYVENDAAASGSVHTAELRAFPLVPYIALRSHRQGYWKGDKKYVFESDDLTDFFLAVVPSDFTHTGGRDNSRLDRLVDAQGLVMWHRERQRNTRLFSPRIVTPQFNPHVVHEWLNCCKTHHPSCRRGQGVLPSMQLIDCQSRKVVSIESLPREEPPEYVALSYVWGKSSNSLMDRMEAGTSKPNTFPRVIEDAIQVTTALGFRFIWVDKYCIDQHDNGKKHEQIMHMDFVYQNAALTIVAASGEDETCGLPGVSTERSSRQATIPHERFKLKPALPSPRGGILSSRWATRGWTYQEAVLSSRRLIFTESQLYFECGSMNCYESLHISFDDLYRKRRQHLDDYIGRSLFGSEFLAPEVAAESNTTRLDKFLAYTDCAEQYSKRVLSFDEDGLNAFGGIIKRFESAPVFPIRQLWGVPFFHPKDDVSPPVGDVDHLGYFMAALSWRHELYKPTRRRKQFPSWSWAGWEGSVFWPRPFDAHSFRSWEGFDMTSIQLYLDDGSTLSLSDVDPRNARQSFFQPKALLIRTCAIPRTAFISDTSGSSMRLSNGGEVRLFPSKEGLDAPKAFKRIQSGRYEAIKLGTVNDDAYLMLIKWYRNSAYRIGTLTVNRFYLTYYTPEARTFKIK
ncbi:tol protein [Colletotrichum musicola]|uniref:Tol protein n=1 Tax=Colletotrichum musicola TaxID=2175873 RepID=A0A8H6JHN6_9PEZI|nr:tol protein [Colletotrichum musicola]